MARTPASRACAGAALALALCVACQLAAPAAAEDWSGWSQGRATHYGDDGGASIHSGSCMFGSLDGSKGTGWNVAALSDHAPDYAGSCGRCYEVACRAAHVRDGYGHSVDRTGSCNSGKTVVVRVTDTCPCVYPSNAYSNTRWCCGDSYHMDLSKWAFEKIGNPGHGVMGIYYRQVPCPDGSGGGSKSNWDKAWPNRGRKALAAAGATN